MPRVHVTTRDGAAHVVEAVSGKSLMLGLRERGVGDIEAACGGCASCGTCHVYVEAGWLPALPAMAEDEEETLGYSEHLRDNSRLACQLPMSDALDGLTISIAPED